MGAVFNQYSLFITVFCILFGFGFFIFRRNRPLPVILAFCVVCIGVLLAWFALRPTQTPLSGAAAEVQARIGAGKPVLLEFQSPYWVQCTVLKPVVDRLENELAGRVEIIRINVQDPIGRELAKNHQFQFTPTFIFFDGSGDEAWREVGTLSVERVYDSLP